MASAPLLLHFVVIAAAAQPSADVRTANAADVAVVARACEAAVVTQKVSAPLLSKASELHKELADATDVVKKVPRAPRVTALVAPPPVADDLAPVLAPRREPGEPRGPPRA